MGLAHRRRSTRGAWQRLPARRDARRRSRALQLSTLAMSPSAPTLPRRRRAC